MFHIYLNTVIAAVTKANKSISDIFAIFIGNTGLHNEEKHLKFD